MLPVNPGGHAAYQNFVVTNLRKYYPNAATSLSPSSWQILDKFWNLDLSPIDDLMQDRYSVFGPEPRFPSDMLRAILVSVEFKITSYTRFVHLVLKDNPRLFNTPPRGSKEWKLEYNARTSAERCNKREKIDYKLEDGRHRSTKMWYCRLYGIMMLQHLDAWEMPSVEAFQKSLLGFTA